ncbi:MAG: hypothetical protein QOH30_972 [Baekduia sp.]|jgi:uncharacterized membrane protein HdeD (DUF308 family)|nr:hypothetical protein [Baekduia sp.]
MFVAPGTAPDFGQKLTHEAAERVAGNWSRLLVNGLTLIVAGVLIFSINWSIRSLATFIGVLFIVQGVTYALTTGIGARVRQANLVTGLLSIATGIVIIAWPGPGIVALAIFLGAWLIVIGTVTISGAFAARRILSDWWLLLITGLLEIPLGILALANPGATLAALITVGGIWAVAVGVMRIVLAFEIKRLPDEVDKGWAAPDRNGTAAGDKPDAGRIAAAAP